MRKTKTMEKKEIADKIVNEVWKYIYERYNIETDQVIINIMSDDKKICIDNGFGMILFDMYNTKGEHIMERLGYKTVNRHYKFWYEYILNEIKNILNGGI